MENVPTGTGDHEDAECGLSGGCTSGSGMDIGPACPFCGHAKDHLYGYGFAGGDLGTYTFCGNDTCEKLIEFAPDMEGLDDESAARINARVDKWRASLPPPSDSRKEAL